MDDAPRTFTRKDSYPDLDSLIMDNIPFAGAKMAYNTSNFYFDPALLERIIKKDFTNLKIRAMMGEKLNAFEQLGLEFFIHIFHDYTGIWIQQMETYQHLIKPDTKSEDSSHS